VTVNTSNSAFLTVLPSTALDGVGWTVRVLSERDYVTPIALVERFAGLGLTVEANAEGGGTVTLDADDPVFFGTLPAGEFTPLADQEALWQILEDGQVRFEFLAEDVDQDVITDGGGLRKTVVAGRGTASVLEWAPVLPLGMPTPTSMTRTFNAHPMAVWAALFQEAQAAGFLTWVTLSFDATMDSHGTSWGGPQALTVNAGDTLLSLLKRWAEANDLVWKMRPGFILEVHQDGGARLENTVVFTQYRSQGEHKRKITRRELANIVYADSGDKGLALAEDTTSATKWRKRAAWVSAGDASDASSRSAVANMTLALARDQRQSRTIKLLPDREGRQPFVDFSVHDWVGVEVPDDATESGARQVMGLAVDIDQDGVVQYEATLQSRFDVRAIKTQRLLDKLGASERSGSGSTAASPIPVSKALSVVKVADLADVDLTGLASGSLLQWTGTRWVDVVANLDLLADVDTGTVPGTGTVGLLYDRPSGLWKPAALPSGGGGASAAVLDCAPRSGSATVVSTSANGTKGVQLACTSNCSLTAVGVRWTTVAARTYRLTVWEMSTSAVLTVGTKVLEVDVIPGAGTDQLYTFAGLALNLDAGKVYAFLISDITNATMNLWTSAVAAWPANRHFWTPRATATNGGGVVRTAVPAAGSPLTSVTAEYALTLTTADR